MSKKKSTNKTPYLSPENYIRQRSKNLPISECFINPDWEENKMCRIIITRKHVTGTVTCCIYLVDLSLLGVKDTFFRFNISLDELRDMLGKHDTQFVTISYELAHNIIYAAVEFADKYEFKPHKNFTSTTMHFLEDDNDDVPLIDIKCGDDDGKPLYINTGFDSPAREKAIIAQLDRTAGEGNYHFMMPGSDDMYYGDYEDEE